MSDDNDSFSLGKFLLGVGIGYLGTKALLDAHKQQLREEAMLASLDATNHEQDDDLDDDTSHPRQSHHKKKHGHKQDGDINTHTPQSYQLADNTRLGPDWLPPRAAIPVNEPPPATQVIHTNPLPIKAPAQPLPAATTANVTYKTPAKWGISLGIGITLSGLALDGLSPFDGVIFFVVLSGLLLYLWGCACWAKAKGRSGWLGTLLGILGLPGLLILLLLDERVAATRQASTNTGGTP